MTQPPKLGPARIEQLRIQNYRALRDIEFKELTPLTVLLGPNGSGKSTTFDVFNFLSECFQFGLRHAWDRRGRAKELKTRGQTGPLMIELKYRERPGQPVITYHLAIDEGRRGPVVSEEWLQWRRGTRGQPFRFLDYKEGRGRAVSGEFPDEQDQEDWRVVIVLGPEVRETPGRGPFVMPDLILARDPTTWIGPATARQGGAFSTRHYRKGHSSIPIAFESCQFLRHRKGLGSGHTHIGLHSDAFPIRF